MKQILLLFLLIPHFIFSQWTQVGSDINGEAAGDFAGISSAINSDGSVIAIGAILNDGNGSNSGHTRVFQWNGSSWLQKGSDIDGEAAGDASGISISLSEDGNILAVGARQNDGNGVDSGSTRVFQWNGTSWIQIGSDIDGENAGDFSGVSVSLSANGNILAIGAIYNDGNGTDSGHARVFENIGGTWTQIGSDIDGEATDDRSGSAVSLNANGNIVAIGAPLNDVNGTTPFIDSGHARVFENIGGTWTQIGSDIDGESSGDMDGWFGSSISLNASGNIVAIGGTRNDGNGQNSGHVRIFENISGTWTQIGSDIDGEAEFDNSGYSVDLNSVGDIVAIGAPFNVASASFTGQVRVFKNISGAWNQVSNDIDGQVLNERIGYSVNLSTNGSTVIVGGIYSSGSGKVRVYNNATLSIENGNFKNLLKLYPNPSTDFFNIEFGKIFQEVKISVYDLFGKEIKYKGYSNTDKIILGFHQFTSGVYMVSVTADGIKTSLKLVVK